MGVFDWLKGRRTGAPPGLDGWRRAWAKAVARAACTDADQLRARLEAAGLPEDEIEVEREMLDGLVALCALRDAAEREGLPVLETGHRAAAGAPCHFSVPASMPDEPGQSSGRLLLTGQRAVFAGPGSAGVSWHAVAQVLQDERDIILVHRGRDRTHRFRCNSYADALTGTYIARHLLTR
jgi:hypothetical protein